MRDQVVSVLRRSAVLRAAVGRGRRARQQVRATRQLSQFLWHGRPFPKLPHDATVRLTYQVMLGRDPDPEGMQTWTSGLASGAMDHQAFLSGIGRSDEFARRIGNKELGPSIHEGRGIFVRSLPPARRILDLGGSSTYEKAGAFVGFGYPYPFEQLIIVELPADTRHQHYADVLEGDTVESPLGPVSYRYHSMVDLSDYPDGSFDLVYSGQTIEHVTESEGDKVLAEVRRVLRPGGHLALDTPNAPVCRLYQDDFIDPDHKVEYSHPEMVAKLDAAGFRIVRQHGLNYAGASVAAGVFDMADTIDHPGLFDDLESCYILAYVCTPA
jgi:SAM-dependent methyltransferase